MQFPADLKYTKEHAWVRVDGAEVIVGITDHAQKELGDIVFIETPQAGTVLARLAPYGVVESVKSVSDLHAPVSGTVVRVNEALTTTPELVNRDPYGAGWIVALSPADPRELEGLMSAADYALYLAEIAR